MLLAQQQASMMQQIVETMPSEALAAAVILTVVGVFAFVIISVAMGIDAYKSVKMANITKTMIEDLLDKGYQPEQIERLVFGESKLSQFKRLFVRNKKHAHQPYTAPPVKPV